jgi:lipooligosaccharide transport system permease protein
MSSPAFAVLNYHLVSYRRTWRGTVFQSFVLPVLFIVGFGLSVGTLVDQGGRLGSVSYLQFIAPAMIASTAMQVAVAEATWPVLAKFEWMRVYESMRAAPLGIGDILFGDVAFMTLRILMTTSVFLGVTAVFGAVQSWWALLIPLISTLLGLAFATPLFALSGRVTTANSFPFVFRFLTVPISLFSGVFFEVDSLGPWVRWLAYVSPLWHGVQLCRASADTDHGSLHAALGHIAYLLAWVVAGLVLAYRSFRRRLSD